MEEWSEYMKNEVQELQKKLAQIDLIMEPKKSNKNGFLEILLVKLKNIKIKMGRVKLEVRHKPPN